MILYDVMSGAERIVGHSCLLKAPFFTRFWDSTAIAILVVRVKKLDAKGDIIRANIT